MKEHLIRHLLSHQFIPEEDQKIIAAAFEWRYYKSNEWLVKAGQVSRQLFFINSGILKITVPHPSERDMVYYFLKAQQFMTFLYSVYGDVPARQGLQAATDANLLVISKKNLMELYQQLPYFKSLIDGIAQLSMADMVTVKNAYLSGSALAKYKLFLKTQPEIACQIALIDVASYLGITPQSLSRIRRAYINT